MPYLPISTSRTSSPLTTQRLLFQLNADQLAIQNQYDQLSTGQRILRLADDPAAARRAIELQRGIDRSAQLIRNASSANAFYNSTDNALSRVDSALIEARGATVEAAQSVLSEDERNALASTIRETIESVFAAGNAMSRDHQLLGGILDKDNAFTWENTTITYKGGEAIGQTMLGAGVTSQLNVNGTESLGAFATIVEGEPLGAALNHDTRLIDMRGGKGVAPGGLRLSGGTGWVDVDLTGATTIGDVVDVLRSTRVDGRALSVELDADSITIAYADGLSGTLAIADQEGGTLAEDLAISNPQGLQIPPIVGNRLTPRVTTATTIDDLAFGAGLDLTGGLRIQAGNKAIDIDVSGAETLSDVLIAINRSDSGVHAELNEEEGRIVLRSLRSGVDYSIGENGGDTARALGIRSATEETLVSELGRGQGISLNPDSDDLVITRPDGVELSLDLSGVVTVDDVMDLIRDHPQNQDTLKVVISLNEFGNGLRLEARRGQTRSRFVSWASAMRGCDWD